MAMATWPTRKARRIAELHVGQRRRRADAQHREIRVRIVADQVGAEAGVVVQAHVISSAVHHMTVGQQIAVGREQKSRTAAARAGAAPFAARRAPGRHASLR
jgi:hypothetical protein